MERNSPLFLAFLAVAVAGKSTSLTWEDAWDDSGRMVEVCSSAVSEDVGLESFAASVSPSVASALESRVGNSVRSEPRKLDSTPPSGFVFILR